MLETGMLEYFMVGLCTFLWWHQPISVVAMSFPCLPDSNKKNLLEKFTWMQVLPGLCMPTDQLSLRWMGISPGIIDLHSLNQGFWQSKLVLDLWQKDKCCGLKNVWNRAIKSLGRGDILDEPNLSSAWTSTYLAYHISFIPELLSQRAIIVCVCVCYKLESEINQCGPQWNGLWCIGHLYVFQWCCDQAWYFQHFCPGESDCGCRDGAFQNEHTHAC